MGPDAQELEGVRRLAGGIAHDLNNLLTAIGGYAELLLASVDADDPSRMEVVGIARASERATALTNQLLAFSRNEPDDAVGDVLALEGSSTPS